MNELWRITLLGGLRAEQGDQIVTRFKTQKVASLLAYLACYPRHAHPREVLVELLWPGSDAPTLRNSLSVALSSLRHQFEPPGVPQGEVLRADRFSIGLNPAAVTTDVAQFERAIKAAGKAGSDLERAQHLTDAVELYQGPLLPGFYEAWITGEQERLSGLFFDAVAALVCYLEGIGDFRAALSHARRAVAADPTREEGQHHLIRLLAADGQPGAALRQYREYERLLEEETGEEPSAALRFLFRRIEKESGLSAMGAAATAATGTPKPAAPAPAPTLPSGVVGRAATVTFLMTDIEGSTRLFQRTPQAYGAARERHNDLLRARFVRHGGQEVKETGDGFVVAFPTAGGALACAVAAQEALAAEAWPEEIGGPLRGRMALHTGDVQQSSEDGQYHGIVLHHASRMLTAAHGGQILVSDATASLAVGGAGEEGFRVVDLGVYRLRDVPEAKRLFQVEWPGMEPADFGPLAAEAGYEANVPPRFTRFFGREQEIAHLGELLLAPAVRLVTVTGPGGTGKTRLALEVAERLAGPFAGAVYFVPLADLTDSALVAGAVLDGLGVPRAPQREPMEQAAEALREKPTLLVLDNFEQITEQGGTDVVQALLTRAPSSKLLVTSRQLLGLSAEREFALSPLPTPAGGESPERLSLYDSVRLFIDRAQQVIPYFQVGDANAAAVAALVAGLEGIPLAIELAAARVQVLTPARMLAQLSHRLDFLASRRRDVAERQRTLRGTVEWSFRLLSPQLQRFFSCLSVFRGGWSVEAAEAVCKEPLALDYLEQLRECSLLMSDDRDRGETVLRFRMLETLREYGQERLEEGGEARGVRERHLAYFVALAEGAAPHLTGARQSEWLERLETDLDNLRAALEGCFEPPEDSAGPESSTRDSREAALRLAAALGPFWGLRGYVTEGRQRLTRALDGGAGTPAQRAKALCAAGNLACRQADYPTARALQEESLSLRRPRGDRAGIAASLRNLGHVTYLQGDHGTARSLFEESLTLDREIGDRGGIATSLNFLGILAYAQGDNAAARSFYEDSLTVGRELGEPTRIAVALQNLGVVAYREGDYEAARSFYEESLAIKRESGYGMGIAVSLNDLGRVACKQGDYGTARALNQESLALRRELGDRLGVAVSLEALAELYIEQEAHSGAPDTDPSVFTTTESGSRAARLLGAAEALREVIGAPLFPSERESHLLLVNRVRALQGETSFTNDWEEGRRMGVDAAVALALA